MIVDDRRSPQDHYFAATLCTQISIFNIWRTLIALVASFMEAVTMPKIVIAPPNPPIPIAPYSYGTIGEGKPL